MLKKKLYHSRAMKITKVYYRHFMGLPEFEFTPGKLTIIRGKNRTGKTTLLTGLQTIIDGGHNARLIEDGQEEGIVGITFDTGDEVIKTIKADKYDIDVNKVDPLDDLPPMTWVRSVFSRFAANPVRYILSTDKKQREQWLLEALPIDFTLEELQKAVGDIAKVDPKYGEMPALKAIDKLHDLLYVSRRDHNRIVDSKRKSHAELFSDTPEEYIDEQTLDVMLEEYTDKLNEVTALLKTRLDNIDDALGTQIEKLRARADVAKKTIREELQPQLDTIREEIGKIRAEQKSAGAVNASVNLLMKTKEELLALAEKTQAYDFAITGLRKLRGEKLEAIPIKGVEMRDGELFLNGLHFDDQLNTEQKIGLVMQIALLHADRQESKVKLIMLDDAEHLDLEHQKAIIAWVKKLKRSDVHFIMAQVDNDATSLTIEQAVK